MDKEKLIQVLSDTLGISPDKIANDSAVIELNIVELMKVMNACTAVKSVSRVEVIDHYYDKGRVYVHNQKDTKLEMSLQDNDRTLKLYISRKKN